MNPINSSTAGDHQSQRAGSRSCSPQENISICSIDLTNKRPPKTAAAKVDHLEQAFNLASPSTGEVVIHSPAQDDAFLKKWKERNSRKKARITTALLKEYGKHQKF